MKTVTVAAMLAFGSSQLLAQVLAQAPPQPVAVAVHGIVTDLRTGDPVPSAQFRLTGARAGEAKPVIITVLTGADGRFQTAAYPAEYDVLVQRPGYFGPPRNGVPQQNVSSKLRVVAGQPTPELKFSLTPGGIITGRVLDLNGRPTDGVTVAAMQVRYQDGRVSLTQVRSATANERGEYRLYWVPPGDYIVAFNAASSSVATPVLVAGSSSPTIQARTFYPGTTDLSRAEPVSVAPGSERSNVNFNIQTTRALNVSGRVINPYAPARPPGAPATPLAEQPGFTFVNLDSFAATEIIMSTFANDASASAKEEGRFELRSIPPGRYDLYALTRLASFATTYAGRTQIDLNGQDLKDVTITLRPLVNVSGRVVFTGDGKPSEKTTVGLTSLESSRVSAPQQTTVEATGPFSFPSVIEGNFRLTVQPPAETFVADIRQGDRSIYNDAAVRISGDSAAPLQIVIGANPGSISGTVTHPEGRTGIDTTIVVVPDAPLRGNPLLYRTARPADSGQFTVKDIAPGTYKIFAWESVPSTAWLNAEFLATHEDEGVPAAVTAGKTTGKDLRATWLK